MIKIRFKIKSLSGETYSNEEELPDDYVVSRLNADFMHRIENNIKKSHLDEIDTVKVTVYFGDM